MLQFLNIRIPVEKYTESTLDLSYGTAVSSIVEKKSNIDDSMILGYKIPKKTSKFSKQKQKNHQQKRRSKSFIHFLSNDWMIYKKR